jgi:hypothetical protein
MGNPNVAFSIPVKRESKIAVSREAYLVSRFRSDLSNDEEAAHVEARLVNANVSLTGRCVQNFRIILGKYLNVKLTAHIILKNRLHMILK